MFHGVNKLRSVFFRTLVLLVWPGLVLSVLPAAAQQTRMAKKTQQTYDEALRYLRQGAYNEAIAALSRTLALDSSFAEAHQALADIYRRQRDFPAAANHYERVILLRPDLTPITWFGWGESLLHIGRYREALDALTRYETKVADDPDRTRQSSKYIEDCQFSLAYLARQQSDIRPTSNLPEPANFGPAVNTGQDEYFPKLTADRQTMIFTRKSDSQENFYQATVGPDGQWQPAILLQGEINSEHFNEGAHCISPDGKYLYFTGCNRPDGLGSCDIYVARREGNLWGKPRNLGPTINTRGWEAQPALSADGRTLYFVSNRRGGQGGYDIWKSTLDEDDNWGTPENLGPTVNTPFDESAPFIHADNQTLYFSSDGWPGFGDKDIFMSSRDSKGKWQTPVNMGFPINDHTEQSAWTVSMNGEQAYFASRRSGGKGGLDIYRVDLPPALRPARVAYLKGLVIDARNGDPIPGALIQITDVSTSTPTYFQQSDRTDGTFLAPMAVGKTYALHVNHPGYLLYSRTYALGDSTTLRQDAYQITVALLPAAPGHTEILQNVFFETAKHDLLDESRAELSQLYDFLINNPDLKIEIGGHTDSTGNERTNQVLSEKRANAVRNYLIGLGIPAYRILATGYGQHRPIAPNDSSEGRRKNRRTDFRIIER